MLSSLFPTLFDMSISASVLIAAVLLFRFFVHRFPKKYLLLLWAVVLFRLLCPIQPESNLSVIPPETVSFAQDTTLSYPERTEISVLSAADAALRAVGDAANGGLDTIFVDMDKAASDGDAVPFVNAYHDQVWLLFLEKIYPVGIVGLLLWQMSVSLRLKRRLKIAAPYEAPIPAGLLPQKTRVMSADGITGAFILGLVRPVIYLPSDLSADAAPYVLAHEGVHLSRRDPLWKALAFLALCLHWFNPLVWAAFLCAASDMEYACDEAALRRLSAVSETSDENLAASYAQTLLSLSAPKTYKFSMLSLDAGNVGGRIRRLLTAKPKRALCILMAVCCILLCLFFIGNPPTEFDADDVRMCSLNGLELPAEQGKVLVDAINDANRSVNRTYDAVGQNTLDRNAIVTFADGSYLEINYLYVSGYSFNPAHSGEDDYTTVLWHRDALGNSIGTWVMEYEFDAVFHDWMIAAEGTPDTGNVIVSAPSDSETGLAVVMYSDGVTADIPLLPVAYDKSLDYDRLPVITVQNDAMIQISGISGETLSVSEDYYENRGNSTFIARQTLKLNRENGGIFSFMTEHRNPNREESAIYYIGAKECRYCFKVWFPQTKQLTLDDVIRLSAKGTELTWEDFSGYKFTETGSGLYIRVYEIDENFSLWIGGGSPLSEPMYIYLARADDLDTRIDIRYGGVEAFIEEQTASDLNTVIDINDLSYTKVRFKHKDSNGQTIHAELKLALPNEWDIAYGFNAYEVIPFAEYAVIQNGEDAVGGVGFLPYSVPDDQAEIREAIFNQIAMGGMSFWDIRGHFDVVTDQTVPYCTALTTVLYSSDLFNDGIDRKNSAIVTYYPEYQLYFAIQFNDGIQNRTLLTEDALRMIAQSIEWVTVRYSDTGNEETEQSALFQKTVTFLKDEFHRVYDPYYDILNLSIYDWTENGTEATFLYTMTFQYRDEQFSDLSPSESNIYFKVIENGDTIDLFCNVSPTDVKWEPCQIDDFVNHN